MNEVYATDVGVRFRDIDPLRHVSHTVYVTYMQQARLEFLHDVVGLDAFDVDPVVAHLEVDYLDQVTRDDEVTVSIRVSAIGTTSFATDYEIRTAETTVATGESVQVTVDSDTGEPRPVPDELRERLHRYVRSDGD